MRLSDEQIYKIYVANQAEVTRTVRAIIEALKPCPDIGCPAHAMNPQLCRHCGGKLVTLEDQ